MSKLLLILTLCTALVGCDFLEPKSAKEPVARVNDTYLYQEDIQALISENTTKQDSISIVANYIQRWATQQVLSVTILFVTFIGMVFFAAKIYRVGILMYGKKPTYKDLLKWLKY